jgi:hypothetical protein
MATDTRADAGAGGVQPAAGNFLDKLSDWTSLTAKLAKEPIGSSTVDAKPVEGSLSPNVALGPFEKLTLNLRAGLSLQILNGPEDIDDDGLAAAGPSKTAKLPPQLTLASNAPAYVKYRLEAGLKAAGSGAWNAAGFEFAGEARAVLLDYRPHARAETVLESVAADLTAGPRTALRLDDVLDLPPSAAVATRLQGSLNASATISWSDVFATHLGDLLSANGVVTPIGLKVSAAASITGKISLVDDFLVVFTRMTETQWRVAVRKANEREIGLTASAGVVVVFSNPDEIKGLIGSYTSAVLGAPLAQVKGILEKADLDALSDRERAIAEALLDRFGLADAADFPERLKKRIDEFETTVEGTVAKIAAAKLKAGFTYEYQRVSTEDVLFEAELDSAALRHHHHELAWGNVDPTLESPSGVVNVTAYLNERTSKRFQSWGFSLGLGKWAVSGKDSKTLTAVERKDRSRRLQRNYLGTRAYAAQWIGRDWSWHVDFKADMAEFAAQSKPKLSEFSYGLALVWNQDGKKLGKGDIDELVDMARLWRIVDDAAADGARKLIEKAGPGKYKAAVQLLVEPGQFWTLHPLLAEPVQDGRLSIAKALAEAMPYWDKRPLAPRQRRSAYAPLWAYYFKNPAASRSDLTATAFKHLDGLPGLEELARLEGKSLTHSFAGLVELNRNTKLGYEAFTRGMLSLSKAIANGEYDDDRVPKVFGDLEDFWTQSHHVRALGVYLLDAATLKGVARLKRSLTVLPDGGDPIVIGAA